jgi:putative membrane protein
VEQRGAQEVKIDSTSNIHRRYRHLFTLPARNRTLVYASTIVAVLAFLSRFGIGYSAIDIVAFIVGSEILLLSSIEIDRLVLKGRNKIATYRRLASLTIASNGFWLALGILGFAINFLAHDSIKFLSLLILGAMFAVSFRALILGSLFYEKPWQAIPLSFVQPVLLFIAIGFQFRILTAHFFMQDPDPIAALIGGFIAILGIEFYMSSINKIKISIYRPLELLRAFLNAWAVEDATSLERFLDATSKEVSIESRMLEITTSSSSVSSPDGRTATIILPGVHPGPFYPIGSSNIPGDIFSHTKTASSFPMIVHSMSDHGLNLSSKVQVERYIKDLQNRKEILDRGKTMSLPVTKIIGKATVNGLALGSTVLITITQAPHGMEDFPTWVSESIESYSSKVNFKNSLTIDTHNSEGEKPSDAECADAVSAADSAVDQLSTLKQSPFKVGIAHSSELNTWIERDVGPAGIGLVVFETGSSNARFSIAIVDSNNSLRGFREKVISEFEKKTQSRILEICTSDTHVTAAKTSDAKGYLALGDVVQEDKFASLLADLYHKASDNMSEGSFSSYLIKSNVKTIGSAVLDDFSGLLDSASSEAKYGARILGGIVLAITVIVALL